jgi:hypothetical protein
VLPKANPADPDDVRRNDLVAFSIDGDNSKDRSAAAIAAKHFDQLGQLSNTFYPSAYNRDYGLSSEQLNIDMDMASGNLKAPVSQAQRDDYWNAASVGGSAVVLGLLTVGLTPEFGPLVAGPGVAGVAVATTAVGYSLHDASTLPQRAQASASQDQKILASWPEINGR